MFRPPSLFNRNRNAPALRDDNNDPFFRFHSDMNRLFDDFFSDFSAPSYFTGDRDTDLANFTRSIHVEYRDKGKNIEIEAELPGVDEDDIDVELNDNLLTIRGEKKFEEDDKENGVSRRSFSSFHRSMSLPFDVDPDTVKAKFKNGALKLTLPKPPELESRTRKIEISKN